MEKRKVFIVTGKNTFEKSGAGNLFREIFTSSDYYVFDDFSLNPKIEDAYNGMKKFLEFGTNTILGFGGGSAMDMAKLILSLSQNKKTFKKKVLDGVNFNNNDIDIYLVPTTTGSGSEATNFAVLYINKKKFSVLNSSLKPNAVCLDPILCRSLNKFQRATSGFDAFCQSIESLWAVGANDQSKGYAGKALSLISKNIKENVNSPTLENTEAMLQGSHFSGKAINISKTTVAHALSYYLTTNFNIPHGYAASINAWGIFGCT